MNSSSESAERVVRISLQGVEVAVRLTGSAAKEIAALLLAISKDKQKVKGKTTLTNMLKSGTEGKVFSIKQEDLKKFAQEAKKYGVLYTIINKRGKSEDGMVDIIARAEDASKINHIVDRFNLATYDKATIKSEISKTRETMDKGVKEKSKAEKVVDDILKPKNKEKGEQENPESVKSGISHQSENFSKDKKNQEDRTRTKPSVRETLRKLKEQKERNESKDIPELDKEKSTTKKRQTKTTEHKQVKSKKRKRKER